MPIQKATQLITLAVTCTKRPGSRPYAAEEEVNVVGRKIGRVAQVDLLDLDLCHAEPNSNAVQRVRNATLRNTSDLDYTLTLTDLESLMRSIGTCGSLLIKVILPAKPSSRRVSTAAMPAGPPP